MGSIPATYSHAMAAVSTPAAASSACLAPLSKVATQVLLDAFEPCLVLAFSQKGTSRQGDCRRTDHGWCPILNNASFAATDLVIGHGDLFRGGSTRARLHSSPCLEQNGRALTSCSAD